MQSLFNLGDLIDRTRDQSAIAVVDLADPDAPREITFDALDRQCKAVARGLLARGLRRGDRVGIASANRVEFLTAYFGAMRAGMVPVPVNHKFPAETVALVLRDADARLVFCDRERRRLVPGGVPAVVLDDDAEGGWGGFLDPGEFATVVPDANEVAMILYTSGSTGRPKGVPLTHGGHLWAVGTRVEATPDASRHRLIIAAPLFHMNGLGSAKFTVAAHAMLVLMPQFDALRYIAAVERYRVTWLTSVPTMMAMVAREKAALARADLSTVCMIRMGSAPVSPALVAELHRVFPSAQITNIYGTTEAGPVVFGRHPEGLPTPGMSVGHPVRGVGVRLVANGRTDAEEGVLHMKTPAIMPGYLNLPEKSREVITEDGWYVSGDILRRDAEGFYYFVGRADDMFVCGGENIYPGEVEQMLERHPDITQACVVPVPDEIKGEKPFAFVVPRVGARLTEADVKAYALAHAPAYQHPRAVRFLDALPLAGTNKIDRKGLTEQALVLWTAREGGHVDSG